MSDPIARFTALLEKARRTDLAEPTAMALATADVEGRPSVRMVLLKGVDARGFVFYTNLESRKAVELMANPFAALCFHWQPLEVQARIEGRVEAVPAEEADAYFASRARGSQVGAWASRQSRPLPSYADLLASVAEIQERFGDGTIPRPAFWSGFRLVPGRIEFWTARADRLHEREAYTMTPDGWERILLYP
jgi:pyridoxamine 5'-phosphate oxidase